MLMNKGDPSRDAHLHLRWQNGDYHAGAELLVRYGKRLRGLSARLGVPRQDTEDFLQETLFEVSRSRFEHRPTGNYWSWLSTIARRKAIRMRSQTGARRPNVVPTRRYSTPWSGLCRDRLVEEIAEMPAPLREVFSRLVLGKTAPEIAAELELTTAAVHMRIRRGRQWLRARGF